MKNKTTAPAESKMARKKKSTKTTLFIALISLVAFAAFVPVFAPIPSLSPPRRRKEVASLSTEPLKQETGNRSFEIEDDKFWKDGEPFRIIGGDLHYFRVVPEYWEDRLLRAKALGLNTIQTYVPWNLHEPSRGKLIFEGIADLVAFVELCHKLGLLVMLRPGPYICAEWDLGGFPAWLLAVKPPLRLRSSDPAYLQLVDQWWGVLLPKVAPLLYHSGGPIMMVQIENEFGSFGDDKAYLHHLVRLAREHLGDKVILYTTDGGSWETLTKGTIKGDSVFSAVDFTTGDDPWPMFKLQKQFNTPGKSPPLSAEFYTGWLTHWGEKIASTDAHFTANQLEKILSRNGSAVLYMVHGGTNFGFYSGANTGASESDYKPDLTSYDYDAPIRESGDVDNAKYKAIRRVIERYSANPLPTVPSNNERAEYGPIQLQKKALLFDLLGLSSHGNVVESEEPVPMETVGQTFGLMLYSTKYTPKEEGNILSIPEVHDKAQVFVLCPSDGNGGRPIYIGEIQRWSNKNLGLPSAKCTSAMTLFILVENMGRVNYGPYIYDRKGILSSVYLDRQALHDWKMVPVPIDNLNNVFKLNSSTQVANSAFTRLSTLTNIEGSAEIVKEPAIYVGNFTLNKPKDTFLSFSGWGRGIAFVNDINIGRYWPSVGPQCNLYIPAPYLRCGENVLAILELESPSLDLLVYSVHKPDFTCSSSRSRVL